MPRVRRVISGGQVGADIAALRAAKALGLQTGGWIPAGYRTKNGNRPEYAEIYGLVATKEHNYPPRTFANVRDSDATIRLAVNLNSPGERCTFKAIQKYGKPSIDVPFSRDELTPAVSPEEVGVWLADHNVQVLNVAGNALTELETPVFRFLCEALKGGE